MNEYLKTSTEQKLLEIEHVVGKALARKELYNGNLSGGTAGAALFYAELFQLYRSEKYLDMVHAIVEDIFSGRQVERRYYSHCSGFSGEAWVLCHLIDAGILEEDAYEAITGAEQFLYLQMDSLLRKGFYDFLHFGLGIAHFFLCNRYLGLPRKQILECILSNLENAAVRFPDNSIAWSDVDIQTGELMKDKYNFGLAHGIPSIIALLCQCYHLAEDEQLKNRAYCLIKGGVQFVTGKVTPDKTTPSLFPYGTTEGAVPEYNSRLGWCYGDLGVCISLKHAAKILQNREIDLLIGDILVKSLQRKDVVEIKMNDAGLCHGTAGLAHIYKTFYHDTGQEIYLRNAEYWIDRTLSVAGFDDGFAGYKFYHPTQGGYVNDYGLLNGVIGVGTVLASSLRVEACVWDKSLLISME